MTSNRDPFLRDMQSLTKEQLTKRLGKAILVDIRRQNEVTGGVIKNEKWIHIPQVAPFTVDQIKNAVSLSENAFLQTFGHPK